MVKFSPGSYFRSLTLIYVTLIFGQIIFALIAYYLRNEWLVDPQFGDIGVFSWIVPLFAAVSLYQGNAMYRKRVREARRKPTFGKKMEDYRLALVVRYAFWEAPSLLAIAAYYLTGQWFYLILTLLIILLFLGQRPDIDKARRELDV
jgi:hypothetical protein